MTETEKGKDSRDQINPMTLVTPLPLPSLTAEEKKSAMDETTPTAISATTIKSPQSNQVKPGQDDAEESSQYDFNYDWKDDSSGVGIIGGDESEKKRVLYEDKCIYSSPLLLWKENFDFSTVTTADIRDKLTKALDKE